jgi:hypothetical protein
MESAELLAELGDRHSRHLVYEGPYRLLRRRPTNQAQGRRQATGIESDAEREWSSHTAQMFNDLGAVLKAFEEWRQRIYRFDNRFGASVVLYQPLNRRGFRWDLIRTRFMGDDPFAFHYDGGIAANLTWREVQRILDRIRED